MATIQRTIGRISISAEDRGVSQAAGRPCSRFRLRQKRILTGRHHCQRLHIVAPITTSRSHRNLSSHCSSQETASLGSKEAATEDISSDAEGKSINLTVSVVKSLSLIPEEDWDACALEAAGGPESANPFLAHAFLLSLEESKSAVAEEGWLPQHLVARDESNTVVGVVPLYLKSHSYGEYVFDHSWANVAMHFGKRYYPKLQSCVPFTPATGPRILVRDGPYRKAVFEGLCGALQQLADEFKISSVHVTFPSKAEWEDMGRLGFLKRIGVQYHWENRGYTTFDDFLADLKQSKRKSIRQERKKVIKDNIVMKRLRGDDIKPIHWDTFYRFYRNTVDNKWGQAYLTREFFHMMGDRMSDRVLLVSAEQGGEIVAGALNLIGGDTLYGRNWGCMPRFHAPMLHFEACYYQAIDAAIEWGLKRVEAGAQGEHKVQRGYRPTATYSAHYLTDPAFAEVIRDFVRREAAQVERTLDILATDMSPFKEPQK